MQSVRHEYLGNVVEQSLEKKKSFKSAAFSILTYPIKIFGIALVIMLFYNWIFVDYNFKPMDYQISFKITLLLLLFNSLTKMDYMLHKPYKFLLVILNFLVLGAISVYLL